MAPHDDPYLPLAFGRALRRRRTRAGMTQEGLSLRAGVDRVYISELERGLKCPTLTTVSKLAFALRTRPSRLVRVAEGLALRERGEATPNGTA